MIFENVELSQQNITFGPDGGRIYSFDHTTDSLIVKTFPGGTLVQTAPLDANLLNEVVSVEYDGYYLWTLTKLGLAGDLGNLIEKWFYDGTTVTKQIGVGKEIPLITGGGPVKYDSEAMTVHTYTTTLAFSADDGDFTVTLNDATFLEPGDPIYFGPSNAMAGEREEKFVASKLGNVVTLTAPLDNDYLVNDQVKYLKDIWLYNNSNGLDTSGGSLVRIGTKTGALTSFNSGMEWRNVTASSVKSNGDFIFIRGTQFLQYRRFGLNAGFQDSFILVNVKPNKQDIVKVYDITATSTSVLKLQDELVYFDFSSGTYLTTSWPTFNVDQEFFANRVFSITHTRDDKSILFTENTTGTFTAKVRDQYDVPVAGRSITVIEDDSTGFIVPGFETFVTDTQGEGVSKYRTGASLDHATPEITITDDVTNINSKTLYVQTPSVDGDSYLAQIEAVFGNVPLVQTTFSGQVPIVQIKDIDMSIPMVQFADLESEISIVQRDQSGLTQLTQIDRVISTKPLVQQIGISDITQVQQFQFLIFAIPQPFSIKNPVDTDITVRIVGFGTLSLIPSSLVFKVNGVDVASTVQITAFPGGLELFYNPPVDFPYGSTVTVEIFILDDDVPPNLISTIYTFETVDDFKDPVAVELFPPNLSINNPSTTEVYAVIRDNETGVDLSSIEFFVNGIQVTPTIEENIPGFFKVIYQSPVPYIFESTVSASIKVSDNASNVIIFPWNFSIEDSSGIFFTNHDPEDCDVLVPISKDVCLEAFGREQGIHIGSATFVVNGKEVVFALVPKVYRKD